MHHGAGDASRASVEAETCWTVRAGSSAEVESPGGCAKCICGWWIGFPGQAMSPLRGVELAGTGNRGENKLRRSMLAVPVGKPANSSFERERAGGNR